MNLHVCKSGMKLISLLYEVTGYGDFEYSGGNTRERGLESLRSNV